MAYSLRPSEAAVRAEFEPGCNVGREIIYCVALFEEGSSGESRGFRMNCRAAGSCSWDGCLLSDGEVHEVPLRALRPGE